MNPEAERYIIRARHNASRWQRLTSLLLTLLGWTLWLWLWQPVWLLLGRALGLGDALAFGTQVAPQPEQNDSWRLLAEYGLIVGGLGGALLLWARVNYWRFADLERRGAIAAATLAELAEGSGTTLALVRQAQAGKVITARHDPDGRLVAVTLTQALPVASAARPPPQLAAREVSKA